MDLMFQASTAGRSGPVQTAAESLFGVLDGALGASAPEPGEDARTTFKLLFAATMQGIAALVVSRRIDRPQGERLVEAALGTMLRSDLGTRALGDG